MRRDEIQDLEKRLAKANELEHMISKRERQLESLEFIKAVQLRNIEGSQTLYMKQTGNEELVEKIKRVLRKHLQESLEIQEDLLKEL